VPVKLSQAQIDGQNADFWNELCGTTMARSLGITEQSADSLRKFDEAYLSFYPYLMRYVDSEPLTGKRVLEIGLGYGTLGQLLAFRGCRYYGLDIAPNPTGVMRYRLALLGEDRVEERVRQGSALELPFPEASFEYVYSIGCLHHTGNLVRAISELHRVLVPGGKAIVMLYNKYSFRRLVGIPLLAGLWALWTYRGPVLRRFVSGSRAVYDANQIGEGAPHTEYVSRLQVRRLFSRFGSVTIESQNCTAIAWRGRVLVSRERLLGTLGRMLGLDLYIRAEKQGER
jgi:SAM-dependent methyltransferase